MTDADNPYMGKSLEQESQIEYLKKQIEILSKSNFDKVKDFHEKCYQDRDPSTPTIPSKKMKELCYKLIAEEFKEAAHEFGYDIEIKIVAEHDNWMDMKKVAKELSDVLVVTYGAGASVGIDMDEAFDAVHESNMSKLDKDGKANFREDGKLLKSNLYREPDMSIIYKEK